MNPRVAPSDPREREQERFPGTINHRLVDQDCQVINHMSLETKRSCGSKILLSHLVRGKP